MAATPTTVAQLVQLGYEVVVETGAGAGSSFPDDAYGAAGATVGTTADAWEADVVLRVNAPAPGEIGRLRDGATLISVLAPALNPDLVEALARRPITALAVDAVPRISRAQSMDVLSSMANIAGYRAVIEAAHTFGRFFTGQVTAAGKVPPAKVLVVGAGVAGLAAIGAASSLGAIVRATDVRPEVAEQVRSLGGEYVAVPAGEAEVSSDGYAREMGEDFNRRAAEMYAEQVPDVDIVITTALIPGRPAPRLITEDDGRVDAVGQRDRRHGRRPGRQRGGVGARRDRRDAQRCLDHRLHRPARPAPGAGLPALRHEPGQPPHAADPREGRPTGARPRRRRPALDHRRAPGREDLAPAAGPGVGRPGARRAGDTGRGSPAAEATGTGTAAARWSASPRPCCSW